MYLGIEIGGTKLQLGVGDGRRAELAAIVRHPIQLAAGARGILDQIQHAAAPLVQQLGVTRVGIGFGGPVDSRAGRAITSHQVAGWEGFPLADWCRQTLGVDAVLGNDCDCAAMAEARWGAGRGRKLVFFVTVGTGIGGGLVVEGRLQGAGRPAVAEIGHLRPGLAATSPEQTVEVLAAGPGLARTAGELCGVSVDTAAREELLAACAGALVNLTGKTVGELAAGGNSICREALARGLQALGWAIAQTITLTAAEVVVVGGGVSLLGEELFFAPLRQQVARYVFPLLRDAYQVAAAELGELVVVHGAVALAAPVASSLVGRADME